MLSSVSAKPPEPVLDHPRQKEQTDVRSHSSPAPISTLFEWNDANGPAIDLRVDIARIDVRESVATVRLELEEWTGYRFADLFTLLRVDGEWKVMNKVFHHHA